MLGKSATERVEDTVDYIGLNTVVPGQYSRAAQAMVKLFLDSQHPNMKGAPFKQMSGNMSLGSRPTGQLDAPRQQARAIHLLWQAMKWADMQTQPPFADAAAIPQLHIAERFEYTMYKALMVYDKKNNSSFAAKHVLENILATDPIRFLTHNHLIIRGSSTRAAGQGDQNVLQFYFGFESSTDRFTITQSPGPGQHQFSAASVVATHWTAVPGRGNNPNAGSFAQIDAIELGGAQIAVTTQFTGCAICLRQHGGNVYAAHIAPGGPTTPPQIGGGNLLARQLCGAVGGVTGGAFANAPGAILVYGREHSNMPAFPNGYGDPNLQYFTMIGFDQGGWQIFAQDNQVGGVITNVRQIF